MVWKGVGSYVQEGFRLAGLQCSFFFVVKSTASRLTNFGQTQRAVVINIISSKHCHGLFNIKGRESHRCIPIASPDRGEEDQGPQRPRAHIQRAAAQVPQGQQQQGTAALTALTGTLHQATSRLHAASEAQAISTRQPAAASDALRMHVPTQHPLLPLSCPSCCSHRWQWGSRSAGSTLICLTATGTGVSAVPSRGRESSMRA